MGIGYKRIEIDGGTGGVTLPAQAGMEKEVLELAERWGIDAVRDSDGTRLSPEIAYMGFTVYSTLCLVREDNEWAKAHRGFLQQAYLISDRVSALGPRLEIDPMARYYAEQFAPDDRHDPGRYWEVYDRSAGESLPPSAWTWDRATRRIVVEGAVPGHVYTASFLADQLWEPVSMYNHITNAWTEEHRMPLDPRHPEARARLLEVLREWLAERPSTGVVRFTTFFYNFDLAYDERGKERRVDWFGYGFCASALAMDEFERERGYRLSPEDLIDQGYGNNPARLPSKAFLDWMDFIQRFVALFARECVDLVHAAGKKAYMFLGDHWAGTEPYGPYFGSIGLDGVVGAGADAVTTRMIADIPVRETEARFYPYLFPDVFREGGDPAGEARRVWARSRRAILRSPMDRMGYGGYLSLACRFPAFVAEVEGICRRFREIRAATSLAEPGLDGRRFASPWVAPFKVCVLNAWGETRRWMGHQVAHSLPNRRCHAYLGFLEALAGQAFDLEFLSFDQVLREGLPRLPAVLVLAGDAGTAWSGGEAWENPRLAAAIRLWVARGGGLIGIGEPSARERQGAYFQLRDILGVEREMGLGLNWRERPPAPRPGHFVDAGLSERPDLGEGISQVRALPSGARVLRASGPGGEDACLAVNRFGSGRAAYVAGLPYSHENARLLERALYWAAGAEAAFETWRAQDPRVELHAYPSVGRFAAVNCADEPVSTNLTLGDGTRIAVELASLECAWFEYDGGGAP